MKRCVALGLAAAVFAVFLVFAGAAAAAEEIGFSSGEATVPVGYVNIVNNDQMKVKIELTNLQTNADGSKVTVKIGGLNDVVKDLKLKSFTVKLSSSGIDNAGSSLAVSTGFIPVTLGDFSKMESGLTITDSTEVFGIKLLGMINDLTSVTLEILPTAATASVSLDISAKVETGTSVNPQIILSKVDVSKLTGNPNVAFSITSGGNQISKSYVLNAGKEPVTATATPSPTQDKYVVPTPYQMPTESATPFPASPVPLLGILAGLAFAGCGMLLKRE